MAKKAERRFVGLILGAIWAFVTAFNLTKAIHIDDTAYLEIAQWIIKSPIHPMLGLLNWIEFSEPISATNQPHLLMYLLAGWMLVFGSSEIAVHALLALFSAGCIFFFFRIARTMASLSRALILTVLMFISPAFIPSQNVMTDVPLLFFVLMCFWSFLKSNQHPGASLTTHGVWTGVSAGCAVLIKYTGLVLIPILLMASRGKAKWVTLIPLTFVAGWSAFNYLDYGHIHILQRGAGISGGASLVRLQEMILCTGGIAPWALMIRGPRGWIIKKDILTAGLVAAASGAFGLRGIAAANGIAVLASATSHALKSGQRDSFLSLWFFGVLASILLISPFMAVRHVLLLLPAALLLLAQREEFWVSRARVFGTVVVTACLGIVLGISDWKYANVYRQESRAVRSQLGPNTRIWYTGHWGWQWYARGQQMIQYEPGRSHIGVGDYFVRPQLVDSQPIWAKDGARLTKLESQSVTSSAQTYFRTMSQSPWGGFYYNSSMTLPWRFSSEPLEQFDIYRVSK